MIRTEPILGLVRVLHQGTLIAESKHALTLHEDGQDARVCLPFANIAIDKLQPSETEDHCPQKGDVVWFDITLPDQPAARDALCAWPLPEKSAAALGGYGSFDPDQVQIEILENES